MKTKVAALVLITVMSVCSLVYAFDGGRGQRACNKAQRFELLAQLPEEKEALFHQTMREAREKGYELREQMKVLREEIKDIITADRFDEDLFREKADRLEQLQMERHATMEEAIVILARQFTADERTILVQLLPGKKNKSRYAPGPRNP
jgi:uncharacterized membrane protein